MELYANSRITAKEMKFQTVLEFVKIRVIRVRTFSVSGFPGF
jgi:hypothetical protein